MNISSIISEKFTTALKNGGGKLLCDTITTSPLGTVFNSLESYRNKLLNRLPAYDALISAFTTAPEIFNACGDSVLNVLESVNGETLREISQEAAEILVSGFTQAMALGSKEAGSGFDSLGCTITSAAGQVYNLLSVGQDKLRNDNYYGVLLYWNTINGVEPLLFRRYDGSFILNTLAFPYSYQETAPIESDLPIFSRISTIVSLIEGITRVSLPDYNDILSGINVILGSSLINEDPVATISDGINVIEDHLTDYQGDQDFASILMAFETELKNQINQRAGIPEQLVVLIDNLINSVQLSMAQADVITVCRTGKLLEWFNGVLNRLSDFRECVQLFFKQAQDAYIRGGFKGLAMMILDYCDGGHSLKDEDGLLTFTDNSRFKPAEYIAGLITTVISIAYSVITAIVSIFSRIVGAILTAVGTVLWGILGSFKQDYSDTYAALYSPATDDDISVLGCFPLTIASGVYDYSEFAEFEWYQQLCSRGDTVAYVQMPGVLIILGPGSFDDAGNVSSVRWEAHPVLCFNWGINEHGGTPTIQWPYWDSDGQHSFDLIPFSAFVRGFDSLEWIDAQYVYDCWAAHCSEDFTNEWAKVVTNDPTTGHLSSSNDIEARIRFLGAAQCFYLWCLLSTPDFQVRYGDHTDWDSLFLGYKADRADLCALEQLMLLRAGAASAPWNTIVDLCDTIVKHPEQQLLRISQLTVVQSGSKLLVQSEDAHSDIDFETFVIDVTEENLYHYTGIYWDPIPVHTSVINWSITLPKYNAATFRKYVALSSLVVITTTAVAVGLTIGWSKFKRQKIVTNKAKFDSAQAACTDALNGERKVYNPETKQYDTYTFDTNSPEGKAYIKQCYKEYKGTAFKNNLWAKIVGGSRYDISSFYGQAEDNTSASEPTSTSDSVVTSLYNTLYSTSSLSNDLTRSHSAGLSEIDSLESIIRLIKGPVY